MSVSGVLRSGMGCFIGGTALGLFFSWSLGAALLLGSISIVIAISWFREYRVRGALGISVCLLAFLGAWAHAATVVAHWDALPESEATLLRAVVVRQVEQKEHSKQVTLRSIECRGAPCPETLVRGVFPLFADISEGDVVSLSCPLEKPERFSPEFDYPKLLAKEGIGYVCRFPRSWKREGVSDGVWSASMRLMRGAIERGIASALPEPEAGLVAGLLVGGDDRLPADIQEKFSRTGLSHIVAVSGYNVSIVAVILMSFFIMCGLYRQQAFWGALLGIGVFTMLVGAPSSAVRAALMAGVALLSVRLGRLGDSVNAILLAAVLMLAFNPLLLRYDIGFQLSFAATAGIILLVPFALLSLRLWDIIATTLVAEIFVLPIIVFHFHEAPLLALLANALVLPLIPITMLLGSVAALLGIVMPFLAPMFGFPTFLLSHMILSTVDFFSGWECAVLETSFFGVKSLISYSVALVCVLIVFRKKIFSHIAPFPPSILQYGGSIESKNVFSVESESDAENSSKKIRV